MFLLQLFFNFIFALIGFAITFAAVYFTIGLIVYAFMLGFHWFALALVCLGWIAWKLFGFFHRLFTGEEPKKVL
jgi:hypothetical protein